MISDSRQIVQKLWSYCNILRDDGLSYPDYVEQLTYLLFLKMAHERAEASPEHPPIIPVEFDWRSLTSKQGNELHAHYSEILTGLGTATGMLGTIFRGAKNKIHDPAKLRLLVVDLIDRRNWSALDTDVKGDAYEGLLEKNAQDTKSGAGQYFTPRPLIRAIVECVRPAAGETIYDPACGTGGFLLAAHEFIRRSCVSRSSHFDQHLRLKAIRGAELVPEVTRLGAMNLLLHGIGPTDDEEGEPPIVSMDSLADTSGKKYDVVLTNPPFGKKSSVTVLTERRGRGSNELSLIREDFWVSTSNKELSFLQHVAVILNQPARAAIVVPDGVLSGSGAAEIVRRRLLQEFDVHTLLRLPTGIFYATGVNANVLFFDRVLDTQRPANRQLWVYDLRTNMHFTLVNNRLDQQQLTEFVKCYNTSDRSARTPTWSPENPSGRWRSYELRELIERDQCNLDLFWIRDDDREQFGEVASLNELTDDIMRDLQTAMSQLSELTFGINRVDH